MNDIKVFSNTEFGELSVMMTVKNIFLLHSAPKSSVTKILQELSESSVKG